MPQLFPKNDEFVSFARTAGYSGTYNDMLYKYLSERYASTNGGKTLTDLFNLWDGQLLPLSNPLAFSGCVLWLDASDTSTITTTGSDVTLWEDKSGQGNDAAQDGAAAMPQSGNNTINGLNVIDFTSASSERLTLGQPASLDFLPTIDEFTLIIIAKYGNTATEVIFGKAGSTSTLRQYMVYEANTGMYRSVIGGAFNSANSDFSGAAHVFVTAVSTVNNETSVDGTFLVSNSILSASSNANDVLIGGRRADDANGGLSLPYNGDIAEIIVYNEFKDNGGLAALTRELKTKWGIT